MKKDNKILTGMNMKDDFKTNNVPPWTSRQPFEDDNREICLKQNILLQLHYMKMVEIYVENEQNNDCQN